MTANKGKVVNINGNLVAVEFDGNVSMNEICYVKVDDTMLKSEVIRIRGNIAQIQVYEMTGGIKAGDDVIFTGDMLSAQLGPGLLGQVYDGLQNPLPELAKKAGAAIVGTGSSKHPNQINNALVFPGLFRGALDVRASDINLEMMLAASRAIAETVPNDKLCAQYIIPKAVDYTAHKNVAKAVKEAAIKSGVARITE